MRSENGAVRGSEIQRANSDDVSKDEIGYLLATRSDEPHSFAQVKGRAHFSDCQCFFFWFGLLWVTRHPEETHGFGRKMNKKKNQYFHLEAYIYIYIVNMFFF